MSSAQKIAGTIFVLLLATLSIFSILSISPTINPVAQAYEATLPQWFVTYRLFDILFLGLLLFAAIIGASALFRPEQISKQPSHGGTKEEDQL